ncbi:aldo/keto reductase [Rubinisphaera italica]|uniref:Putative oxidoreductase n=1 Tax=Rubinisphaera italica TaxID=2527969 RepID=A0A5C5XEW3_9PLAN|nr:aldo/keto reductase [Rubinisphaera italica]TWT61626.1 putative oxidoreductase [Rubinisphaera italica]
MELRELGQSGLKVSPVGLGLAALGRPGYINLGHADDLDEEYDSTLMQHRAAEVLQTAYEAGVRYFDAARSYGKAEQFLSHWIAAHPDQQEMTVGSKWGYEYTADWKIDAEVHEQKQHSLERLNQQWGESQALLSSHLNLYQIHSATLESGVLRNDAVLNRLKELKEFGFAIGLSVSGPEQSKVIEQALTIRNGKRLLFDTVQATWNLLERSAGPALEEAYRQGMGIIIKESLANGRLTERNRSPEFAAQLNLLQSHAQRLETTIDALCMAYVIQQPWVDVVLSGAATSEHLLSNLAASKVIIDEDFEIAFRSLHEDAASYWKTRSQLNWN